MINCKKCSRLNEDHYRFCLGCGDRLDLQKAASTAPTDYTSTLSRHCGSCGADNSSDFDFCGKCGAKLEDTTHGSSSREALSLSEAVICLNEGCRKPDIPRGQDICPECNFYFPSMPVLPGGTLLHNGQYQVDFAIGCGGFGVTYRAFHTGFEDVVAIKEFFPQGMVTRHPINGSMITASKTKADFKDRLQRFKTEGRTLRRIQHRGVVRALDTFEQNGTAYLVMDFIEGHTLRDELERAGGKIGESRMIPIVSDIVDALTTLHTQDIHHLDLKPENILLTRDGRTVLVDFGSARAGGRLRTATSVSMTERYAAPEVAARKTVGPSSDLYSLAVMVCELLTGTTPPTPVERIMGEQWQFDKVDTQWRGPLKKALTIAPDERPSDVARWWSACKQRTSATRSPTASTTPAKPKAPPGFVLAPSGSFWMGSKEGEGDDNERPRHKVKISRPFLLGTTPVTQGQWEAVMGNNPSHAKGTRKPVECVNWWSAVAYCNALSEREGLEKCYELRGIKGVAGEKEYKIKEVVFKGLEARGYRLPTEAEWEYACLAGSTGQQYGDLDKIAWYRRNSGRKSHEVGLKEGNRWGLHDMLGNVWEWTQDWYSKDFYSSSPVLDPVNTDSGHCRPVRGGSFNDAGYVRAAVHFFYAPGYAIANLGFRCARSFH